MDEPWKKLFAKALEQLRQGGISSKDWFFGGGTVLTQKFNHRESKDIDIFFRDRQFLNFISPRVNDAVEASLVDYAEQAHHTRLVFPEGEVDFIIASQITSLKPVFTKVLDTFVNVEQPVEIIAKKIHYRGAEFKARDFFDLAVVYDKQRDNLLKNAGTFADKIPVLLAQVEQLEQHDELEKRLSQLSVLDGGKKIRGHELELCKHFLQSVGKNIEKGCYQSKQ